MVLNRSRSASADSRTTCKTKILAAALSLMMGSGTSTAVYAIGTLATASVLLLPQQAVAKPMVGFSPQRYKSGTTYGTGVFFAPYRFTVYSEPSEKAAPIATYSWNRDSTAVGVGLTTPSGESLTAYPDRLFLCYYPAYDVAMMAVASENGEGWAEVVYDQQKKSTGWVKLKDQKKETAPASEKRTMKSPSSAQAAQAESSAPENAAPEYFGTFQTWMEFMKFNGIQNGAYWLSGVPQYDKAMRTKNEDAAKLISVTMIRRMKVRFVRGNWLLIEAQDFENHSPIGWVRWRDDDGNLMMFPNITGKPQSMMTLY